MHEWQAGKREGTERAVEDVGEVVDGDVLWLEPPGVDAPVDKVADAVCASCQRMLD